MTSLNSKQQSAMDSMDDLVSDLKKDALLDDVFISFDRSSVHLRTSSTIAANEQTASPYDDFELLYGKIASNMQETSAPRIIKNELNSDEDVSKAIDSLAERRPKSPIRNYQNSRTKPRPKGSSKAQGSNRCKNCSMRYPFYAFRCKYCREKVVSELYYYSMLLLVFFILVIVTWVIITSKTYR